MVLTLFRTHLIDLLILIFRMINRIEQILVQRFLIRSSHNILLSFGLFRTHTIHVHICENVIPLVEVLPRVTFLYRSWELLRTAFDLFVQSFDFILVLRVFGRTSILLHSSTDFFDLHAFVIIFELLDFAGELTLGMTHFILQNLKLGFTYHFLIGFKTTLRTTVFDGFCGFVEKFECTLFVEISIGLQLFETVVAL